MRIISGKLKGRSINFLKNLKTRPLKDKVRESIFNILQHSKFVKIKINDANILASLISFLLFELNIGFKNSTYQSQ